MKYCYLIITESREKTNYEMKPKAFEHPNKTLDINKNVPKIIKIFDTVALQFLRMLDLFRDMRSLVKHGISNSSMKALAICWPSSLKHGTAFRTANALENATM